MLVPFSLLRRFYYRNSSIKSKLLLKPEPVFTRCDYNYEARGMFASRPISGTRSLSALATSGTILILLRTKSRQRGFVMF